MSLAVLAWALLVGGCRSDYRTDMWGNSLRQGRLVEVIPDARSDEERASILAVVSKVGPVDPAPPGGADPVRCRAVALAFFVAPIFEADGHQIAEAGTLDAWTAAIEDLVAMVPPELRDEIATVRAAGRNYVIHRDELWYDPLRDPPPEHRQGDGESLLYTRAAMRAQWAIEDHLADCPDR